MNVPEVLKMEAFVAPVNFDPDAQELNIVKAFSAYQNEAKKYIFSVSSSSTTTVLPVLQNRSYVYSCLLYTSPSPRDRTRSRMPYYA
jgi:hypothetical protein